MKSYTIEKLESREIDIKYILGVRMRKAKALSDVSFDATTFEEVSPPKQRKKDPSPLRVSEKVIEGHKRVSFTASHFADRKEGPLCFLAG